VRFQTITSSRNYNKAERRHNDTRHISKKINESKENITAIKTCTFLATRSELKFTLTKDSSSIDIFHLFSTIKHLS
jgi:hypothetical protein